MFLLRRGTPCHVRRTDRDPWRPHVCSEDRTELAHGNRLAFNAASEWVFQAGAWQVRVAPHHLERSESYASTWHHGITGTREGVSAEQLDRFRAHLREWVMYALDGPPTFHHGGCVGADRQAHRVIREVYGATARIVIHPASDQPERLCDWTDADELREPAPSLDRNRAIVGSVTGSAVLLALPKEATEQRRSGTWSTVRRARESRKGVVLFGPAVV
ncbi:hypothetical protein R5W24_004419 [Gemmata sp. JC717]|uniref:hypothetical protein n=1 Tax=Gemmata algarum TaxID=2975278 RepID=UPI0021BA4446|nr:hypothetical protein [Gemmata algarum]MDY3555278.1 hypothetical protein [Gemmata algarum]